MSIHGIQVHLHVHVHISVMSAISDNRFRKKMKKPRKTLLRKRVDDRYTVCLQYVTGDGNQVMIQVTDSTDLLCNCARKVLANHTKYATQKLLRTSFIMSC